MLIAFLHTESCVLDFMLLGRAIERQGSHEQRILGNIIDDVAHVRARCDDVASLIRSMDELTDMKMIREALVYRPILVH